MPRDPYIEGSDPPFSDKGMVEFEMSLRDAFRGVASFVDATEDALEPAAGCYAFEGANQPAGAWRAH